MKYIIVVMIALWNSLSFSGTFDFAAQALYLQPDLDEANYRGIARLATNTNQYMSFNPSYAWGFEIEGAYRFNNDYDLDLNWYHVKKNNWRSFGSIVGNEGNELSTANGTIEPGWNAVNLEFGQRIFFHETNLLRIHAGLQYAYLSINEVAHVVVADLGNIPSKKQIELTYSGLGPRMGADLSHGWNNGFSIYSHLATAMLTGSRTTTTDYIQIPPIPNRIVSTTNIVPEIELKLGANYTYVLKQGSASVDIGWMWFNYFKALYVDNFNINTNSVLEHTSTSFAMQGPYVGIKWVSS